MALLTGKFRSSAGTSAQKNASIVLEIRRNNTFRPCQTIPRPYYTKSLYMGLILGGSVQKLSHFWQRSAGEAWRLSGTGAPLRRILHYVGISRFVSIYMNSPFPARHAPRPSRCRQSVACPSGGESPDSNVQNAPAMRPDLSVHFQRRSFREGGSLFSGTNDSGEPHQFQKTLRPGVGRVPSKRSDCQISSAPSHFNALGMPCKNIVPQG